MARTIINNEYYLRRGKSYRVNSDKWRALRTDILKPLIDICETFFLRYCRVHIFRFDLHLRQYTDDNRIISILQRRLFKRIKVSYKMKNVGFVWVREKEKAASQHYHCVIYLDGNKIRHPGLVQHWVNELWSQISGGTCHWSGYHNVPRNDEIALQKAIYHLSYLAKPRGKGQRPLQTKDYGWTRSICASERPLSNAKGKE